MQWHVKPSESASPDPSYQPVWYNCLLTHGDANLAHGDARPAADALSRSVAATHKPYAAACAYSRVFAASGYSFGYITGYTAQKEATEETLRSLPDAFSFGSPTRIRTWNLLIK